MIDVKTSELIKPLCDIFLKLEGDIIEIIVKHIRDVETITATDLNKLTELRRLGYNLDKIETMVGEALTLSQAQVHEIIKNASIREYNSLLNYYDLISHRDNTVLNNLIKQIANSANGTFANIANSRNIGLLNARGQVLTLAEQYNNLIDTAIIQIKTGQQPFNQAIRQAVRHLADGGVRQIFWESGYSQRVDTAIRRNILGGISEMSRKQAEIVGEQFGHDGMEISWHDGYRPSHDFGGLQFDLKTYKKTIEPLMQEPNCYHTAFPIILDISTPNFTKRQLERLREQNETIKYYEGKPYNRYQAEQRQRQFETELRKQRDRKNAFNVLGDVQEARRANARYNQVNRYYRDFSQQVNLPVHRERMAS